MSAFQGSNEDVGEFLIMVTPRPGNTLTDLEQAVDAIVETLKQQGPTAEELQKAKAGEELGFIRGLESNLGKAMRLANGAGFHADPGYFRTEYTNSQSVSADDIKRVAAKYLAGGRVVLSVVPEGKADQAARPNESKKVTNEPSSGAEVRR